MLEEFGQSMGLIIVVGTSIGLLNIILFFKIWGMTNNVAEIKDTLKEWLDIEHPLVVDRVERVSKEEQGEKEA